MLTLEDKVQDLANGLGISFYIWPDGRITQNGGGLSREIRPHESAKQRPHVVEPIIPIREG